MWVGTGHPRMSQLGLYQRIYFGMREITLDYFVRNYDENGIRCRDRIRSVHTIDTSVDTLGL